MTQESKKGLDHLIAGNRVDVVYTPENKGTKFILGTVISLKSGVVLIMCEEKKGRVSIKTKNISSVEPREQRKKDPTNAETHLERSVRIMDRFGDPDVSGGKFVRD